MWYTTIIIYFESLMWVCNTLIDLISIKCDVTLLCDNNKNDVKTYFSLFIEV